MSNQNMKTDKTHIETDSNGVQWACDTNGNRCSTEYFGDITKATKALLSLKNCKNCKNCMNCMNCNYCNDCRACNYCDDCRACSYCNYCRACSYCDDCRACSYCDDCRACSYCNYCRNKKGKSLDIPKIKNIHQQIYTAASQDAALDMSEWHSGCGTTHCRAGWVIALAGKEGAELEAKLGTSIAALRIYRHNSEIPVHMPEFFVDNNEAMESMRKAAEQEEAGQ